MLLDIKSSTLYYKLKPVIFDKEYVQLLKDLDELHLNLPSFGARRLRDQLRLKGYKISRSRTKNLMNLQGIHATYPRPKTSQKAKGHKIYPYLLGDLDIVRPNQVWSTDITYIPMARGFHYLVAIMDIYSRKILTWKLSNSLDVDFCVEALKEAIERYGTPEIFNSDQGSQFTSEAFTGVLKHHEIKISMDGKGRWVDNVFIERFWRTLKYDEVYIHAYENGSEARENITRFIHFYNSGIPHSSLGHRTPDSVYFEKNKKDKAA